MRVKETHTNVFNGCEYLPVKISQHVSKNLEQNSPIVLFRSQSRILVHRFEEQNKLKRRGKKRLIHFEAFSIPTDPISSENDPMMKFIHHQRKECLVTNWKKWVFQSRNEAFFQHRTNCEDH